MVFIQKHSEEIYWLNRRILFLKMLDGLLDRDASEEEISNAASQFKKVENPSDVAERLHEIYGRELP
jgi:hypothetical protein